MQTERLRQMPFWRKVDRVDDMNEALRTLALAGLRQRHHGDAPAQLRRRLVGLMVGPELAERVHCALQKDR